MTLKEKILATPYVRQREPVTVPQWPDTDGKLFVQTLTALEDEHRADAARQSMADKSVCYVAELVALVLVDDKGDRVFTTPEEIKSLANGAPEPLDVIGAAYNTLRTAGGDAGKKSGTRGSQLSST